MSSERVKVRVKVGVNEAEIEAPISAASQAIELIPTITSKLSEWGGEPRGRVGSYATKAGYFPQANQEPSQKAELPEIRVERDDSLTDVITKIFKQPWGRDPRRLGEVKEVLESYGIIYPKQSVAVALLRLAQSGKLRRFKGGTGEFVYVGSTVLAVEASSAAEQGGPLARG